jgi:hypothetical protein
MYLPVPVILWTSIGRITLRNFRPKYNIAAELKDKP